MMILQECDVLSFSKSKRIKFAEEILNRELKIRLYKLFYIAPTDNVEYLRYVIFLLTDTTLLIKNTNLYETIIESGRREILDDILDMAPKKLSSIFLRYKLIFLALKKLSSNKTFFNRLRKDSKKTHIPLPIDYFNDITNQISKGSFDINIFRKKIDNINIFRKIRLLNALTFRLNPSKNIVYKIRNGKSYVDKLNVGINNQKVLINVIIILKQNIANQFNIDDKIFYIPNYVEYGLPTTEKQFIGNFPN